jgi:ATP-dependent Clp protease ATP-binding subunit ClpC
MERHTVSRLVGAPPGYIGFEEGGQLTEKVRRKPYSVVLLDEVEKAHPEVFNALLQVLEEGRLTDGKGRTVGFRNVVVIMTSNVGANVIEHGGVIGFRAVTEDRNEDEYQQMKDRVLESMKQTFRPEFLNRVDEVIVFRPLTRDQITSIVDLMLKSVTKQLAEKGLTLEVTTAAKAILAKEGFDPKYGARPLRRAIQRMIENPLAEEILAGNFTLEDSVIADADGDKLIFHGMKPAEASEKK